MFAKRDARASYAAEVKKKKSKNKKKRAKRKGATHEKKK